MSMEDADLKFNFIFLGDSMVGKTSIIRQYSEGLFSDNCISTIGVDFRSKMVNYKEKVNILIKVWDTAGQEKFGTVAKSFYRNSNGVFIVCDLTNIESFDKISSWVNCILEETTIKDKQTVLLANKMDLPEERQVSEYDLQNYSKKNNIKYFEVSAKTGENIETAFNYMIDNVMEQMHLIDEEGNVKIEPKKEEKNLKLKKSEAGKKKKKKCC